jgi:hypothetical protein
MNLVQFHTHATLTPAREVCMNLVKSAVPEGCSYEFYDKDPVDPLSIDPLLGHGEPDFGKKPSYSMIQAADLVFLKMASEQPQMLKIDSDTIIDRWFDFPLKGRPYFNICNGRPDIAVFYVNDCPEFFDKLLQRYINDENHVRTMRRFEWAQNFLKTMLNEIYLIPDGYFRHLALGHIDNGPAEGIHGTEEYEIRYNAKGKPYFTWLKGIDL